VARLVAVSDAGYRHDRGRPDERTHVSEGSISVHVPTVDRRTRVPAYLHALFGTDEVDVTGISTVSPD